MKRKKKRILCPVDLSDKSHEAIELATTLAKDREATIDFTYVTPLWFPGDTPINAPFVRQLIDEHKAKLYRIKPTDSDVMYEHHYIEGNAGPTLVKASENADVVVMGSHGRTAIARLLMGSVANYVLRHSKCPVILVKGVEANKQESDLEKRPTPARSFVAELMRPVSPINAHETIQRVLESLTRSRETATPVVDGLGKCIGILTTDDIGRFLTLKRRYDERDESVLQEVLDTDEFGQLRTAGPRFDRVDRHMTTKVISVRADDSQQRVMEAFADNPRIHHLVVIDEHQRPVGMIDQASVTEKLLSQREAASAV